MGNGNTEKITQKGTIKIGTTTITDVIHANVTRNLLSVPQLMQKNYKTVFKGNKCRIYDSQGRLTLTGTLGDDNLITVDTFDTVSKRTQTVLITDAKVDNNAELMHRRWNHINLRYIQNMARNNSVIGLKMPKGTNDFCQDCVHGKMHKLSVPKHSEKHTTRPLELVHIDTKSMQVPSKSGYRYFMLLVDDYTRMKFGYPAKTRDEQLECFKQFKAEAERKFPACKVKALQSIKSDGAGEFISKTIESHLKKSGVSHQ